MTTALSLSGFRHRHRLRTLALVGVTVAGAALVSGSASAAGSGALTPYVNCVTVAPEGTITAYFGYQNTTGSSRTIPISDLNQVFPASPNQGQPTVFNQGNYPQVFSVTFDGILFPSIAYILDNKEADANDGSPRCANGVSSPATDVTGTGATVTGVVVPSGTDTTYSFEYGTTPALGSSTPVQDFGAGTQPALAQASLTGLSAQTRYYFRIDTSSNAVTTQGDTLSFTTAAPLTTPPPSGSQPVGITTVALVDGVKGSAYLAQLAGTGGTVPYSWSIAKGSLPAGLTLDRKSGLISGKPKQNGTSHFTVQLKDQSRPKTETMTRALSITVAKADRR